MRRSLDNNNDDDDDDGYDGGDDEDDLFKMVMITSGRCGDPRITDIESRCSGCR